MGVKNRKNRQNSKSISKTSKRTDLPETIPSRPVEGISKSVLREGIEDLGGTIRLALGAAEDMLNGSISSQEATVVTTAVGRVLKAVELQFKYCPRNERDQPLALPAS